MTSGCRLGGGLAPKFGAGGADFRARIVNILFADDERRQKTHDIVTSWYC
jgi:hypothetical protein